MLFLIGFLFQYHLYTTLWYVLSRTVVFENTLGFQALIEDLCLKWCIFQDNTKNKISGSNVAPLPPVC